jgi:transketolase
LIVPAVIIANTIKGKGVSFLEGQPKYHNAPLSEDEFGRALAELEAAKRAEERLSD